MSHYRHVLHWLWGVITGACYIVCDEWLPARVTYFSLSTAPRWPSPGCLRHWSLHLPRPGFPGAGAPREHQNHGAVCKSLPSLCAPPGCFCFCLVVVLVCDDAGAGAAAVFVFSLTLKKFKVEDPPSVCVCACPSQAIPWNDESHHQTWHGDCLRHENASYM